MNLPPNRRVTVIDALFRELVASRGIGTRLCSFGGTVEIQMPDARRSLVLVLYQDERRGVTNSPPSTQADAILIATTDGWIDLLSGAREAAEMIDSGDLKVAGSVEFLAGFWPAIQFTAPQRLDALARIPEAELAETKLTADG